MTKDDVGSAPTQAATAQDTVADDVEESWSATPAISLPAVARYRVGPVIGRGGMGEVVSAADDQLGRTVAIKRLRANQPAADALERFEREARIQGRLDHPAIAPVHELARDDAGRPYFVMKQLSGVTLADVLARTDEKTRTEFSRVRLLRTFVDVCLAIEFAHTKKIVHRDLKPANIMLGDFGEVYVIDWGIAKILDETQEPEGLVIGTFAYMSPEQKGGELDIDGRADVYALGCMLAEILSRDGDSPPELDAIAERASDPDRATRTATAREVGDGVQRFLDGDRDLAVRHQLAATELVTARNALDSGDRTLAIRASARALALDPQDAQTAQFVGRLMLEPPTTVPPEVENELVAMQEAEISAQARVATFVILGYLPFFPILYLSGFRAVWFYVIGTVMVLSISAISRFIVMRPGSPAAWANVLCNAVMIAIIAHLLSPFLVAPVLASLSVTIFSLYPGRTRMVGVYFVMVCAVLGPWLLEALGVLARTTSITGNTLVLHFSAREVESVVFYGGLALFVALILFLPALLAHAHGVKARDIKRDVLVQRWQLRQLVPRAATSPSRQ